MKKKIRNNFFKIFLCICCIFVGFIVFHVGRTISSTYLFYESDEELSNLYYEEEEKYNFLETLEDDVIVEGIGINIKEIPNDKVAYKIYNNENNVIFYYHLKEDNSSSSRNRNDSVTITLSEDFYILDEEYDFVHVHQSLSDYIYDYRKMVNYISILLGILFVFIFFLVIFILFQLSKITIDTIYFKTKKSYKKSIDYKHNYKNDNK